jgi:hypothetical protein
MVRAEIPDGSRELHWAWAYATYVAQPQQLRNIAVGMHLLAFRLLSLLPSFLLPLGCTSP